MPWICSLERDFEFARWAPDRPQNIREGWGELKIVALRRWCVVVVLWFVSIDTAGLDGWQRAQSAALLLVHWSLS